MTIFDGEWKDNALSFYFGVKSSFWVGPAAYIGLTIAGKDAPDYTLELSLIAAALAVSIHTYYNYFGGYAELEYQSVELPVEFNMSSLLGGYTSGIISSTMITFFAAAVLGMAAASSQPENPIVDPCIEAAHVQENDSGEYAVSGPKGCDYTIR